MHNKRVLTSAPILAVSAIVFATGALWAESNLRNTHGTEQAFLITSDDGNEFVSNIDSSLPESIETTLAEYIASAPQGSARLSELNTFSFYSEGSTDLLLASRSYLGRILASRNRFNEAFEFLESLSQEERHATDSTFAYAETLKGLGNYQAAVTAYEHHITQNPNHQAGHINYAILLADLERHMDAIEVLNQAIEITNGKRKGKALSLLGMSLMELAAFGEAETAFERSIEYRPTHGPTWRRLAYSRSKIETFSEAEIVSTFERSDAVSPGNARTKVDLADYYFSVGRFDDALDYYKQATKLAPTKASYAIKRATNLIASERPAAARKVLKKAKAIELSSSDAKHVKKIDLLLNGNDAKILKLLGNTVKDDKSELGSFLTVLLHLKIGDFESAAIELAVLPQESTFIEPGKFLLAKHYFRAGRISEAENLLTELTVAGTQSPIYWLYFGRTQTAQNSMQSAHDAHKRAYDLYPESGRVTIEYTHALRNLGQNQASIDILLTYLEDSPKDSRALLALAGFFDLDRNYDRAEQIYRLVYDQQSGDSKTAKKLASVQLRANRIEAALTTLDQALEQSPSDIEARLLKAETLSKLGRKSDSVIEYQRVLKLDEDNETAQYALDQLTG